ncbi:uncharacterized protein LOC129730742 isoform X2 [Wyeomyia smithii]|uniref:uncharacterized protein LOC129730742 isoform X2 n=1 Tax=Wyeomyia smithii TaxID=174621 RepID=UPI002467EE0C|nr:uncharacterized protein LOC129730742 isoform X2 [Wyeomyia smithii]
MRKSIVGLFIVLMLFAAIVEPKPQGCSACGSSHEELVEKCCNKCKLCRDSFDVEAPPAPFCQKSKNYSFNMERVDTPCSEQLCQTHDIEFEAPCDPEYPTCSRHHFRVSRPPRPSCDKFLDTFDFEVVAPTTAPGCKELRLTANVEYDPRHCECDQFRN